MRHRLVFALTVSVLTLVAIAPQASATVARSSSSLANAVGALGDPRIEEAVAACSEAWAEKANIKWYGVVVDLLRQDNLGAMRGAMR